MTKKTEKKTRASQYENILSKSNIKLSDCIVLGFTFSSESISHLYHFMIMEQGLRPLIYDGPMEIVRVIIDKNDNHIETYKNIAQTIGGIYKECKKYNDYE